MLLPVLLYPALSYIGSHRAWEKQELNACKKSKGQTVAICSLQDAMPWMKGIEESGLSSMCGASSFLCGMPMRHSNLLSNKPGLHWNSRQLMDMNYSDSRLRRAARRGLWQGVHAVVYACASAWFSGLLTNWKSLPFYNASLRSPKTGQIDQDQPSFLP